MRLPKYSRVCLPEWIYLGGEALTPPGASVQANLPSDTTIFKITVLNGEAHYRINHVAGGDSPGYVPEEGSDQVGPLGNLDSLHVYADAGSTVYLQYFREG